MRLLIATGLSLSALLAGSGTVAAQQEVCGRVLTTPAVGSWAKYDVGKEGNITMSIVGKETRGGREMVWYEMALQDAKGQGMIMKMLVPGYPYEMTGVEEMIIKGPGQPATRMPQRMISMMRGQMAKQNLGGDLLSKCTAMGEFDRVALTVPAGTFQTLHWVDPEQQGEAWVAEDLPFHLVKATSKDGKMVMVLVAHGTNATSAITETPQDMPGMN